MIIENQTKGKPAMIIGAILVFLGLIGFSGTIIILGILVFLLGKALHWFYN
jgi:hypothetical protein